LLGGGIGIVLVVLVVVAGVGYLWYRYNQIGREDVSLDEALANEPQNFLIVGSDTRDVIDESDPDATAFLGEEPGGRRSDTIMVARVDAQNRTVDLVSFPRDLWVPIAGTGSSERINTAYGASDGPQRLIDTIRQDFDIEINHYVEIDFDSFRGIVDAVDGIPLGFQTPMRDRHSGLYIDVAGCSVLDGDQALAFARARHLEYQDARGRWVDDESADLGRINRQQVFMRRLIDRAASQTNSFDLKTMNDLLSSTADNLKVDTGLDLGQMVKLARHFKDFTGEQLRSRTLPVYPDTTNGGASVLKLDTIRADPILDVFRGDDAADDVPLPDVRLVIENGSGVTGQAGRAEAAFESLGFVVESTGTATTERATTIIRHAPGAGDAARQVAEFLSPGAQLQEDAALAADHLVIVTGDDFEAVVQDGEPVTVDASPSTTTSIPAEIEYTEPVGVVPEGAPTADCG
jgi:LCP family protein required for cell wall assembly